MDCKMEVRQEGSSVQPDGTACESRDVLSKPWQALLVFGLPAAAMVITGSAGFSSHARTIIWPVALAIMGTACTANAYRCRRIHCYFTGPFFLLMALLALLYGLGFVPLGQRGWNVVGLIVLVGAIGLCCLTEAIFGKYRRAPNVL
jgi:hypothetical protein